MKQLLFLNVFLLTLVVCGKPGAVHAMFGTGALASSISADAVPIPRKPSDVHSVVSYESTPADAVPSRRESPRPFEKADHEHDAAAASSARGDVEAVVAAVVSAAAECVARQQSTGLNILFGEFLRPPSEEELDANTFIAGARRGCALYDAIKNDEKILKKDRRAVLVDGERRLMAYFDDLKKPSDGSLDARKEACFWGASLVWFRAMIYTDYYATHGRALCDMYALGHGDAMSFLRHKEWYGQCMSLAQKCFKETRGVISEYWRGFIKGLKYKYNGDPVLYDRPVQIQWTGYSHSCLKNPGHHYCVSFAVLKPL